MWNANCDATKPKGKSDLKKELEVWERTQGGKAQPSSSTHNPGAQIKDKDFDAAGWSATHDDSFRALVARARKKATLKPRILESTANEVDLTGSLRSDTGSRTPIQVDTEMTGTVAARRSNNKGNPFPQERGDPVRRMFEEGEQSEAQISADTPPSEYPKPILKLDREVGIDSGLT